MQKNKDALMQYVEEIKNLRNLILNDLHTPAASSLQENQGDKKPTDGKVGNVPGIQGGLASQAPAGGSNQQAQ